MFQSRIICLFLAFLSFSASGQKFCFPFKGEKRKFILHLPENYDPSRSYPLVLNFHGIFMTAGMQKRYSRMNEVADRKNFIVIYPQAKRRKWNTGLLKFCYRSGRDDVGFVNALLDSLIIGYSIDTTRIYSTGMSMGGYFSYRLACELGHRIAAIASVTGVMSDSTLKYSGSCKPIPVLHIHGTDDPIVKYHGIKQSLAVEETIDFWLSQNRCRPEADTTVFDLCRKDRSCVALIRFSDCTSGAPVWFYKVYNGGHTWPGTRIDYIITGRINHDIRASEVIWDFFERFSLADSD